MINLITDMQEFRYYYQVIDASSDIQKYIKKYRILLEASYVSIIRNNKLNRFIQSTSSNVSPIR